MESEHVLFQNAFFLCIPVLIQETAMEHIWDGYCIEHLLNRNSAGTSQSSWLATFLEITIQVFCLKHSVTKYMFLPHEQGCITIEVTDANKSQILLAT